MRIVTVSTFVSCFYITATGASGLPAIPDPGNIYTYPAEDTIEHEATWLQWPHNYGWDPIHQERYEEIWLQMTLALHTGEKVHIVAYDEDHRDGIKDMLLTNGADLSQIRFFVYKTDDVWTRDNGPLFVFDQHGNRIVEDWKFNGWVSCIIMTLSMFSLLVLTSPCNTEHFDRVANKSIPMMMPFLKRLPLKLLIPTRQCQW